MDLNRIKKIAKDIISDDEWVNDSHSQAEHTGVKDGLMRLIRHLEETGIGYNDYEDWLKGLTINKNKDETYWFHDAKKMLKDGYWYVKISDIK
tara:strand:+ start:891 stop:1169 length:279 start_codon:yes stop_codon:yes gene_type:complete